MNLLVTNTRNAQAYAIIRFLRPEAQKIVVTMEGSNRFAARLSHAANSRLVDKRYYVPSPVEDWKAGNIKRENTEREEAYIRAIERICEEEQIDTIFPSIDPHVYVFSKNKVRLEKKGILIPIPDYEIVITPLDKYRTVRAAQEVGFPCPRTYLPESEDDLRRIAEEVGFPLVLKPRFTVGGRGMEIVRDSRELSAKTRLAREKQDTPMIQEYIPGRQKPNLNFLLGKKGELKVGFSGKQLRHFSRLNLNFPTARESSVPEPYVANAIRLVQNLGYWGAVNIETKIDARDGIPKLMEINARFAASLGNRIELGINEPLICLRIARGEEVETIKEYPVGILFLDPIEDFLGLAIRFLDRLVYKFRVGVQKKAPMDPFNPPMAIKELVDSYRQTHLNGKRKFFNPYFRYFFRDPLVSVLWWLQYSTLVLRAAKELGR
jgi:predicted ATP-grasp superfamily ATP-dependent carboligase